MKDKEYTWMIVESEEDIKRLTDIVEGLKKKDKIYNINYISPKLFINFCKRLDVIYFYADTIGGKMENIEPFKSLSSGEKDVISQYSATRMVDLFNHLKEYGKITSHTYLYFTFADDSILLIGIFDKTAVIAPIVKYEGF
jgi:hypothetical protein